MPANPPSTWQSNTPMVPSISMIAMLATAAACSNLDHEVVPDVTSASLAVDRTAPAELAMIDVSLELSAGSKANHTIELWEAWLMQPTRDVSEFQLKLAFPGELSTSIPASSGS